MEGFVRRFESGIRWEKGGGLGKAGGWFEYGVDLLLLCLI